MDRRKQALIVLAATFAVGHLERQVMSVSLNAIGLEFSLSDTQLGLLSGAVFAIIIAKPFVLGFLFFDSTPLALSSFAVSASLATVFWAPSLAYIHGRLPSELRPMATAITLFAFNIVGMGLGPTAVGVMSDQLAIAHGPRSIGLALSIVQVCGVSAAFHYWKITQSMALRAATQ